ncbi:PREDICTED: uncharacterized protein LOC104710598 [Camelina sativa]|uniref:Uncharacterized protein LOC104710598 n=1 Tax=Camelina sativa TaxID=90675 RepID=A0ABM0TF86_CAMSA|nr:PREDICTED: uncharacterized protein LOC104710598 [Camelina sativa]
MNHVAAISGEKKGSSKVLDICVKPIGSELKSILETLPQDVTLLQDALFLESNLAADAILISNVSDPEKLGNNDLREVNLADVVTNVSMEKTSIQNDGATHEDSITQLSHQIVAFSHLQVPISTLEPSHRSRSDYLGVLERFPSASMRKTSAQSLYGLECVDGKQHTHHVFDGLCVRSKRLNQQRKLSLSPKTWMFKFRTRNLQHNMRMGMRNKSHMSRLRFKRMLRWDSQGIPQLLCGGLHTLVALDDANMLLGAEVAESFNKSTRVADCFGQASISCPPSHGLASGLYCKFFYGGIIFAGFIVASASWLGLICVWADFMLHNSGVISAKLPVTFQGRDLTADSGLKTLLEKMFQGDSVWEAYPKIAETLHFQHKHGLDLHGSLCVNLCRGYPALVNKSVYFSVWHCWKQKKLQIINFLWGVRHILQKPATLSCLEMEHTKAVSSGGSIDLSKAPGHGDIEKCLILSVFAIGKSLCSVWHRWKSKRKEKRCSHSALSEETEKDFWGLQNLMLNATTSS